MNITTKYDIGDIVYHRVDNQKGMIISATITGHGINYTVQWSHSVYGNHAEIELSLESCPDWVLAQ